MRFVRVAAVNINYLPEYEFVLQILECPDGTCFQRAIEAIRRTKTVPVLLEELRVSVPTNGWNDAAR